MKRLIIHYVMLLMILQGCATIGGNHQVVAVDSNPRGLDVYISGATQPIGSTPFFYSMQRVPHDDFSFRSADSGHEKTVRLECSFRWVTELAGNSVFAFASPIAAVSAVAADLVTGAAFDCDDGPFADLGQSSQGPKWVNYCRRFVVLPPQHFDSKTSEAIAKLWQDANFENLRGCDQFIELENSRGLFQYLSIDHSVKNRADRITKSQLNLIGMRTSATHLVQLDYREATGTFSFSPVTYDIFTLSPDKDQSFPSQKIHAPESFKFSSAQSIFFHSLALFPNSITVGSTQGQLGVHGTGLNHASVQEGKGILRRYVDQVSLTSTLHPMGFADWDYSVSAFPSLELFIGDYRIENNGVRRGNLQFESIVPLYGISLSFFTLLGTFSLEASLGPVLWHQSYEAGSTQGYQASIASQFAAEYTGFFTENLFFQVGTTTTKFHRRVNGSADYNYESTAEGGMIRIGYFVPWIKTDIRSLFPN